MRGEKRFHFSPEPRPGLLGENRAHFLIGVCLCGLRCGVLDGRVLCLGRFTFQRRRNVRRVLGELTQPFDENRFVPVCHGNASFLSFSLSYAQKSISFTVACRNFLTASRTFTFLRPKVHRFYSETHINAGSASPIRGSDPAISFSTVKTAQFWA